MTRYAATLDHEDWLHNRVFIRDTEEEAEEAATAFLLERTYETRDRDEFPDDENWVDVCLMEDWTLSIGIVVE